MLEALKYIDALHNKNNKIIAELYKKYFPKINSYILKEGGHKDIVLDIFHDALMYLMSITREKASKIQSFEAYFFVICKNLWKKSVKNKVIELDLLTLKDKETDLALFTLEQEYFDFYIDKFQLLTSNCKDILGSYFNGMSYEEILKEHNYSSINTVRQRVFKCRTKLILLIKTDKKFNKLKKWMEN